ncbi:MAG: hypothetical protein GX774_07620 [Armatimonadetes bacterium]|nr:hypothetical protein [Armatimonadota bacterium]
MLSLTPPFVPGAAVAAERASQREAAPTLPEVRDLLQACGEAVGSPVPDLLFRTLAGHPQFLVPAWQAMAGNLRAAGAEAVADHLRRCAALSSQPAGYCDPDMLRAAGLTEATLEQIRAWTALQRWQLPRVLLFAAAWDAALAGLPVGGTAHPTRAGHPNPPADPVVVPLVSPDQASARVRDAFQRLEEAHGYTPIHDYYRGLACWPEYFDRAVADIRSMVPRDEYGARAQELWWIARLGAASLPDALPAGTTWLTARGLSDTAVLTVRGLLDLFARRVLPDTLLDATLALALLRGSDR